MPEPKTKLRNPPKVEKEEKAPKEKVDVLPEKQLP